MGRRPKKEVVFLEVSPKKQVVVLQLLSCVQLFHDPMDYIAHQVPLSMGFSRQQYQSGLPFPPPGALPDPGVKPLSPALAGRFFTIEPPGKPKEDIQMARKTHEKMLNITNYQRNANQNYNLTPIRMAIIKNLQATSAGEGVEKREPSYSVGGNIFCYSHWWPVWRFLKKLKAEITYNLAIILLGTYLDKNMVRKDICTTVFIAMLFPTAKTSKQQIWPSGDE